MTYEDLLKNSIEQDDRIVVMTAENRATLRNIPSKIKNNFIDVGISEMTMIGASAGLALRGRKPVVHALAAFLTGRAYEFIKTDIALPNLPVILVGAVPGFLSTANGPTHQAIDDIGLMSSLPNMCVFCPADVDEMLIGMESIFQSNKPYYIRFNDKPAVILHNEEFIPGKAEVISQGNNIAIFSCGFLLNQAIEASNILNSLGLSVRVINIRTPKPIDEGAIIKAAGETQLIVTLEDHLESSGIFSIISKILVKHRFGKHVLPIALNERWFRPIADLNDLLEYEGFTGKQIATAILNEFKKKN